MNNMFKIILVTIFFVNCSRACEDNIGTIIENTKDWEYRITSITQSCTEILENLRKRKKNNATTDLDTLSLIVNLQSKTMKIKQNPHESDEKINDIEADIATIKNNLNMNNQNNS